MRSRRFYVTAILALFFFSFASLTSAFELEVQKVTERIYALVGPITPRTADNLAMNNTMGFVLTDDGVMLIDSGATYTGGEVIAQAVASVTNMPIRWVINTGAQDHRWLGNGYFVEHGAQIHALARTVDNQRIYANGHMLRLNSLLDETGLAGTNPAYAAPALSGNEATLNLGGMDVEIRWLGATHFPDDVVVIIPAQDTIFTGDMVFTERLLGVQGDGASHMRDWAAAFETMAALNPAHIVPGHGHATDLAQARADTGDYLHWLIDNIAPAVEDFEDLSDVTQRLSSSPFDYLANHDLLHKRNVNLTFIQLEIE